jgi:outer membrane protein with beta-barrel domain
MRGFMKAVVLSATVVVLGVPGVARADGYVNPWAGVNFGSDFSNARAGFGVNAGGMGAGVIGAEASFGFSPNFFGDQGHFGSNNELDLMGNLIVGIPFGGTHGAGFRPYVTGGAGLIRTHFDVLGVSTSNNDWGWNLGAGAMGYFNDHVGLRADVRYLRNFTGNFDDGFQEGNFHFWRTSFGLVVR